MRLKTSKNDFSIILKENPPIYTDWKINDELRKMEIFIEPYYDENGDLVELKISNGFNLKSEIFIPDKLPRRNYLFVFGSHNTLPIYSSDCFTELDKFLFEDRMIVYRTDGGKMSKSEIDSLRKEFF